MKKQLLYLFCISFYTTLHAQSFEATTILDITTTPSDSRSANFVDINGDGWDDIFITNSAGPGSGANNFLYINNTDGTFTTITNDAIVQDNSRSVAASFADADNDGDLDAYMVTWGTGTINYFYRNNGNGSFSYEPTNVSGTTPTFSEAVTWIDANNDQLLDIFFTNSLQELENLYYENQGLGDYSQVFSLVIDNEELATRSVDWVDYDGDGDSDLFVTNEGNSTNSLYRNDGPNNFIQITSLPIVQDTKNSAGSSWADIDNDGDFDLFVANYNGQSNQLFLNENGNFTEQTASIITATTSSSFGSTFGDLDNDGDLDLIVCNAYSPFFDNNYIYLNDGSGNFSQDTTSSLATHSGWTYSAALGDYNNDGWLDVVYANNDDGNQVNSLFRNTGSGNNWVKINCTGTDSNKSAIGTKVRVRAIINNNEVWQTRKISANSGYCSQNSYTVHFGLGDATTIEELEITWPIGTVESFTNIELNTTHNVVENAGLGIPEVYISSPKLYPNPVKDSLVINLDFNKYSNSILKLMDLNGKVIKTFIVESNKSYDVSSLSSGNYIYTISHKNKTLYTGKLIKID